MDPINILVIIIAIDILLWGFIYAIDGKSVYKTKQNYMPAYKSEHKNSTTSNHSSSKSKPSSYDKGYEDAYYNDDYDEKRYESDKDYATGVDDAWDDSEEYDNEW